MFQTCTLVIVIASLSIGREGRELMRDRKLEREVLIQERDKDVKFSKVDVLTWYSDNS